MKEIEMISRKAIFITASIMIVALIAFFMFAFGSYKRNAILCELKFDSVESVNEGLLSKFSVTTELIIIGMKDGKRLKGKVDESGYILWEPNEKSGIEIR